MKKVLFPLILILLLAVPGLAGDWYVRTKPGGPVGSGAPKWGTGDGTSYENAWTLGPTYPFVVDAAGGATADIFYLVPNDGTAVFFVANTMPGGITKGATYYLKATSTVGTYTLSEEPGGEDIDITSNGSGLYAYIDGYGRLDGGASADATTDTVTIGGSYFGFGNGFNNVPVYIWSTGNLPKRADTGERLTPGMYYICSIGTNYTFKLRDNPSGSAIDLDPTDIGTGTHFISYMNWNAVQPGDTIHLYGTVDATWSQNLGSFYSLKVCKSGTAGNPITIQGESGHRLIGAYNSYAPGGWTQHATVPSIYYRSWTTVGNFYERNSTSQAWGDSNILPRYVSNPPTEHELSLFQPGDWGRTSSGVLYIRPLSTKSPNENYYIIPLTTSIRIETVHNIILKNINTANISVKLAHADNITLDGCNFKIGGVSVIGQCDNLEIKNCSFKEFADGIYLFDGMSPGGFIPTGRNYYATNVSIHDNSFIKTFTQGGPISSVDHHAIGLQDSVNVKVYNNYFERVGTACTYYSSGATNGSIDMYNNYVKSFWVRLGRQDIAMLIPGNPTTVVAWQHGYSNGNTVVIEGITQTGWTALNGSWTVANKTDNTFTVAYDSSGLSHNYNPDTDPGTCKTPSSNILAQPSGAGLDIHGLNSITMTYNIYNNIVCNGPTGLRMGLTGNNGNHKIYNNVIYNCNVGIAFGHNMTTAPQNVDIKNNIIYNPYDWGSGLPVCFIYAGSTANPVDWTVSCDYNGFYKNTGNLIYFRYGGAGLISLDTWKSKMFSGGISPDAHSLTSNPSFINGSGSFTNSNDFCLNTGSPAIKAGTAVGLSRDFHGNRWRNPPSLGAIEYWKIGGKISPRKTAGSNY